MPTQRPAATDGGLQFLRTHQGDGYTIRASAAEHQPKATQRLEIAF